MTRKSKRWLLSTLFGVFAVAFGFWLGVSLLNWYSEREDDSDNSSNSRPVSILSTQKKEAKPSNDKSDAEPVSPIEIDDGLLSTDSLDIANIEVSDSLLDEKGNIYGQSQTDSIVASPSVEDYHFIKKDKDQLIANLSFSLPKSTQQKSETTWQLDSILGSQPEEPTMENLIIVELWKSPLNFRGYKFSNNVLVIYDMTQLDALNLYYSGGKLYLSYFDVFYQINPTKQFRPLTPTGKPLIE